jgi:AraC-like DNA-binding protein
MARGITVDDICRSIESPLAGGRPVIEEIAQLLSVSSRVIQQTLQNQGVSFSELVEWCCCQTACDSLEHARDSAQEIAAFLGYRNTGSFSRAFRRWTGKDPHTYRNHLSQRDS